MENSVYFRRFQINDATQSATMIVSSQPLSQTKTEIAGFAVAARKQQQVQFGVLALTDPKTGKSMKANHPTIKSLQEKLNVGDEIPGFRISDEPVTNQETGEAVPNLFWVEPV